MEKYRVSTLAAFTLILFTSMFSAFRTNAQTLPPPGKYDTTSYPAERKELDAMFANHSAHNPLSDTCLYLNDDFIAVGPEGKVSYGYEQWKTGLTVGGFKFKLTRPVPGTRVLRIYNGNAAVLNFTLNVVFDTPKGDLPITVVRTETYIKQNGKWHFVSGQGTRVQSKEEFDKVKENLRRKSN